MTTPKVTIGIPTFNRSAYLREAIHSALGQTYSHLEIIVSDNGSTDDTNVVLSRLNDERITVVRHAENRGMVHNWNACLTLASGDFFLLLSDDDVLESDAIENLMIAFSSEGVSLSYGRVQNILESGSFAPTNVLVAPRIESGEQFFSNVLMGNRAAFPSATLFRTSEARGVGGYPDIGTAADFGLHLMLAMKGLVASCSALVARYRLHPGSESFSGKSISSQVGLLNWIASAHPSLGRYRAQIIRYSSAMVYSLGRYHALRGHKSETTEARLVLERIFPGSSLGLRLRLFELAPVQRAAEFRRWLKRILNRTK